MPTSIATATPHHQHPTRSAPLCQNCACIQRTRSGNILGQGLCAHASQAVEPLYGLACTPVTEVRAAGAACGPEGALYERSRSADCPTCHGHGRVRAKGSGLPGYVDCPACTA